MKTKTYSIEGIFSRLSLVIDKSILVKKREITYEVSREEAANLLRVARKENLARKIG